MPLTSEQKDRIKRNRRVCKSAKDVLASIPKLIVVGATWNTSGLTDLRKQDKCATLARNLISQLKLSECQIIIFKSTKPHQFSAQYVWYNSRLWSYRYVVHNLPAFPTLKNLFGLGTERVFVLEGTVFMEVEAGDAKP